MEDELLVPRESIEEALKDLWEIVKPGDENNIPQELDLTGTDHDLVKKLSEVSDLLIKEDTIEKNTYDVLTSLDINVIDGINIKESEVKKTMPKKEKVEKPKKEKVEKPKKESRPDALKRIVSEDKKITLEKLIENKELLEIYANNKSWIKKDYKRFFDTKK